MPRRCWVAGANPAYGPVGAHGTRDSCLAHLCRGRPRSCGDAQQAGINAVPAVIINQRHLISGGQPVEVFERALRETGAESIADA